MAKTQSPKAGLRARTSTPAKSFLKARVAKAAAAKAAVKAPVRKAGPVKGPAAKVAPPRAPAKKAVAPKPTPAKAKSSSVEQSPASEAEIIGAVSGKLSGRGAAGGFSWLGSRSAPAAETPAFEVPAVTEEAAAPPAVPESPPPPAETATVIAESVPPPAEVAAPAPEQAPAPVPEAIAPIPPPEVVPVLVESVTTVETPPAPTSAPAKDITATLSQAAANEQALSQTLKTAAAQLGWTLALQAVVFGAFCVLVKGGVPYQGLPQFLAGAIPLFAMLLIVAAFVSFGATQQVLGKLEGDRRRYRDLLSGTESAGPDDLTIQRQCAHLPSQIILGILLLTWFIIGVTVWWL